jgi:hypothetical protein
MQLHVKLFYVRPYHSLVTVRALFWLEVTVVFVVAVVVIHSCGVLLVGSMSPTSLLYPTKLFSLRFSYSCR